MALCTGARRGEMLNLKWRDVNFDRGVAIVHHSKNGERRSLIISVMAKQVLAQWSKVRRIETELAEAMGHKTLAMVKRYAHLTDGHTRNVVARMTESFLAA